MGKICSIEISLNLNNIFQIHILFLKTCSYVFQSSYWELVNAHYAQENKLGLLFHLGCGTKTPQSLGERLTLTLTGPVTIAATYSEGQALALLTKRLASNHNYFNERLHPL